jgi:PIN domain nuclease of toxin-antitoxin system
MISGVLDTHAFVWYLNGDQRLSTSAQIFISSALQQGQLLSVPAISIVEIIYLEEKNKIPQGFITWLLGSLQSLPFVIVPLDINIIHVIRQIPRTLVPEMPDRVIVATALALGVPLVTKGDTIRQCGLVQVIW